MSAMNRIPHAHPYGEIAIFHLHSLFRILLKMVFASPSFFLSTFSPLQNGNVLQPLKIQRKAEKSIFFLH